MAKTVTLSNGREFPSQKAATEHFRAILHGYGNGDEITDPAHHSDLVALLERYDAAITSTPSKIGTGIVRFERRINYGSGFATAGFWVERTDGSASPPQSTQSPSRNLRSSQMPVVGLLQRTCEQQSCVTSNCMGTIRRGFRVTLPGS